MHTIDPRADHSSRVFSSTLHEEATPARSFSPGGLDATSEVRASAGSDPRSNKDTVVPSFLFIIKLFEVFFVREFF